MVLRSLLVVGFVLAAGVLSVADALVRGWAPENPAIARLWPAHPLSLRILAMDEIGQAAAAGRQPAGETMELVRKLGERAPLRPEPFLIQGALAMKAGEAARAERLLLEARRRDPRAPAPRFLLADMYMRRGSVLAGLREMVALARLVNGVEAQLATTLATYARTPGALSELKRVIAENPALEPQLLAVMASDPSNADLILVLAKHSGPVAGTAPPWRSLLLQSLIAAQQYEKAHSVWARFAGEPPVRALYRPDFAASSAPPPFNWTLVEAGGGVAERIAGGGLRVLYFGREDVALASQTTLLPPGRYQLAMTITGQAASPDQLRWTVKCLPGGNSVLELPLGRSRGRALAGQFVVPAQGCAAQRFELLGIGTELPKSSDVTIGALRLTRVSG